MNRSQQNTWRITQGLEPLKQMEAVVTDLQHYINTYSSQPTYKDFSDELFIEDILYGLGTALSDEYRFASGYRKFKKELINHLIKDADGAE